MSGESENGSQIGGSSLDIQLSGLVERLSEVQASDLVELVHAHETLDEVIAWAISAEQHAVLEKAKEAADLLERVILEEVDDTRAALVRARTIVESMLAPPEQSHPESGGGFDHAGTDRAILELFLSNQPAVLEAIEAAALGLERDGAEVGALGLRRLVHTLKGEAGLLGLEPVVRLCHALEGLAETGSAHELAEATLSAKDWLGRLYAWYGGGGESPESVDVLLASLHAPVEAAPTQRPAVAAGDSPEAGGCAGADVGEGEAKPPQFLTDDDGLIHDFTVEAVEHLEAADRHLLELESDRENASAMDGVFRAFHTIKGVAGFIGLAAVQETSHQAETLLDRVRKGQVELDGVMMDVVFEASDAMKSLIKDVEKALESGAALGENERAAEVASKIAGLLRGEAPAASPAPAAPAPAGDKPGAKTGEILVRAGVVEEGQLAEALAEQGESGKKLGEVLIESGRATAQQVGRAIRSQRETSGEEAKSGARSVAVERIKVDADRLDQLVDSIGELVIAEAMVREAVQSGESDPIRRTRLLRHMDKITRELQEMATGLRMVSLTSTFQRMNRLARDVSKKLGKDVEFVTEGAETELDKTVVDQIGDPLVHMVRNAIDHGIESDPAAREELGKAARGRVCLRAFYRGGNVQIELEDDGKGLDPEALRRRAIERGVIQETDTLSEDEALRLVFAPGFSTAASVTEISGRGVGMDVVRQAIDALQGRVDIESSKGVGTTFRISLPLTLAVMEGIVVRSSGRRFVIPTMSVVRMVERRGAPVSTALDKGRMLSSEGELLALHELAALCGAGVGSGDLDGPEAMIVIIEHGGRRMGLEVDAVLGQQQIVVKSLGPALSGIQGVAGGSIMPDGRVGLILDVEGVLGLAGLGARQVAGV